MDTRAVVVDMKAAADVTKLLLLHRAAVCTTDGGANQRRRFALAKAFQVASRPDGQSEVYLLRGIQRLSIGKINDGLIGPELSGFEFDLIGGASIGRLSGETGIR